MIRALARPRISTGITAIAAFTVNASAMAHLGDADPVRSYYVNIARFLIPQ
jgi:hypothetical protein